MIQGLYTYAATALVAGQKQATEDLVATIKGEHDDVLTRASCLLALEDVSPAQEGLRVSSSDAAAAAPNAPVSAQPERDAPARTVEAAPAPSAVPDPQQPAPAPAAEPAAEGAFELSSEGDWAEQVQTAAQVTLERIRLGNGEKSWPYDRVFPARYLKGAVRIRLIDGYLADPHQLRNLGELLLHLAESARPKEVEVLTKFADVDATAKQDRVVDNLAKELFRDYGVTLTLRRDPDVHDRFLVMDHGVLFKLGRGLDFYKPATGLARHRPDLREVRKSEVDVFCVQGHALLKANAA